MLKGSHHTEDVLERIRLAKRGVKYPNRKKPTYVDDSIRRAKISRAMKGKKVRLGIKSSIEARIRHSISHRGEKGSNWKGGISLINRPARLSFMGTIHYQLWREAVFKRDDFTCRKCLARGVTLAAHHILNYAEYSDLRIAIDNGVTLCQICHRRFHKIFGMSKNNREQLGIFLTLNE